MMQHAVEETLEEIGAGEQPRLLVLNKVGPARRGRAPGAALRATRDAVLVSAVTGEGLEELGERIEQRARAHAAPRSTCWFPTRTAEASPSCTSWRAR